MTSDPPNNQSVFSYAGTFVSRALSISKTGLLAVALIAALGLNVATLTIPPVFHLLSTVIEAITDAASMRPLTVRKKQMGRTASLQKSLQAEKNYSRALRRQVNAAEKHMKVLDDYNTKLIRKIDASTHVNFKGQKRTINSAVRETSERISKRVAVATARSTGSVAAESIPYIGIGAIIGVTTWEVHDACETMKDLHELDVAFNPGSANEADHSEVCGQKVPTKSEIIDSLKRSPSAAWQEATELVSSLPTWEEAKQSAKDAWIKVLRCSSSDLI